MANEASIRDVWEEPINFICASTDSFEKGAILMLQDPRTVSGTIVQGGAVAGICAREKIASDGRTSVAMHRRGIFDLYASGAILRGDPLMASSSVNFVATATAAARASGAAVLGHALETASTGEQFQGWVNL